LARGLEVLSNRFLKRRFVLLEEAAHAIDLLYAPSVTARHTRGEEALLPLKYVLE
jgi:hypothetical protein